MGTPFISREDLTDYLGRNVAGDDGALIAVDFASDLCRQAAEQQFTRGTTTIYMNGTGTDALLLPEVPVNSVGTVQVADASSPPIWTTAGSLDYALRDDGILYATNTAGTATFGTVWPRGRQNIRVTYDHGYDEVPEAVRGIALQVASRYLVQGPTTSESMGAVRTTYAGAATDLLPTERWVLRKQRRTR